MKSKKVIILIITIVIALLILGYIYLNKQEDVSVKLLYRNTSMMYYSITTEGAFENAEKYHEIELTDEQQKEIVKLYKKTNKKRKAEVQLAFLGDIKLEFSDGNTIIMDKNNDTFGMFNDKYRIFISSKFKEYILNIVN